MLQADLRIESLLFNYETTYKTDYRFGDIHDYPKTVYKPWRLQYKPVAAVNKDVHTMTEWKGEMPAFSLTHAPKDIVRTHPNKVQQRFEKQPDLERESVQKTRPRLVMTPAVSMDDIADARARSVLCTDMYTSDTRRAMREAVATLPPYANVKAPLPDTPALPNPFVLPKLQPPIVPPEWRMDSVTWDGKQLRAYCNPTQRFWLSRDPPPTPNKCGKCDEWTAVRAHRKMMRNLKNGH